MNNLQKMKEVMCKDIMEMNADEFYDFISETELNEFDFLSMEGILTCPQCRTIYGDGCKDMDDRPCRKRFVDYCLSEVID